MSPDRERPACRWLPAWALVERDGTSFTMVLPFRDAEAARELLEADPYYPQVRSEVGRALGALHKALREEHGDRAG